MLVFRYGDVKLHSQLHPPASEPCRRQLRFTALPKLLSSTAYNMPDGARNSAVIEPYWLPWKIEGRQGLPLWFKFVR